MFSVVTKETKIVARNNLPRLHVDIPGKFYESID